MTLLMTNDFKEEGIVMLISLSIALLAASLFLAATLAHILTHKRWIATQAKVISAEIDPLYLEVGLLYQPLLRYEFTVDGNKFEGTNGLGRSFISRRRAMSVAACFKQRSPVGILFNPDNPNQSRVMATTV